MELNSNYVFTHIGEKKHFWHYKGSLYVMIFAGALFATFVSPQIGLLGRGLKTSIPCFLLLWAVFLFYRSRSVKRILFGNSFYILSGLTYTVTGIIRFLLAPTITYLQNFVISALLCFFLWLTVLVLKNTFPRTIDGVRWIVLAIIGLSFSNGIPLLVQNPGVARLTMGNPDAAYYSSIYSIHGIASYNLYTVIAIAWPSIANWLFNYRKKIAIQIIGWCLLLAASIAVLLSTFTMAAVLLILGIVIWLLLTIVVDNGIGRSLGILFLLLLIICFPLFYNIIINLDATSFIVGKATRIIESTISLGARYGDETGRVDMFVRTIDTFFNYPLFGAWGLESNYYIGGHSSWADLLALHGLLGFLPWLVFLAHSFRGVNNPLSISKGVAGATISLLLVCLGGILNPTLTLPNCFLLIWLFDQRYIGR